MRTLISWRLYGQQYIKGCVYVLGASAFFAGGAWAVANFSAHSVLNKPLLVSCTTVPLVTKFSDVNVSDWMSSPVSAIDHLQNTDGCYRSKMEMLCMELQGHLCKQIEEIDKKAKFRVDKWERRAGGGGISCILENGEVFEKAGVNISVITGNLSPMAAKEMRARHKDIDPNKEYKFFACGISSVIHPLNPYVPTTHFNFRYFEVDLGNNRKSWWYGGGADLTPYYLFDEDAKHFHEQLKLACDKHHESFYPRFKKWCDDYFYLTHRANRLHIMYLSPTGQRNKSPLMEKTSDAWCVDISICIVTLVVEWQLVRRGRYVEFNLIYDRGTKFGLATPEARIESILMSLPRFAQWTYCYDNSKDPRNHRVYLTKRKYNECERVRINPFRNCILYISLVLFSWNLVLRVIETSNGVQYILPRPSKWALGMPVTSIRFIPTKCEWAIECNSQGEVFTFKPDLEGFETLFKEPQQTHTLDLSPDGHEFATDGTDRRIRIYTIRPDGLVGLPYEISNKTSDFSRGYGGNQLSGGMQKLTSDTLKNKNYEVLNKNNTYGSNYPDGRPSQILNTTVKPYSLTQCYNLHETHQLSTYEPTAFSDQHQSDHHHFFVIPSLREYLATSPGINIIEGHSMHIMALKYHLNKSTMLISAGWDNLVKIWDTRQQTGPVFQTYGPYITSPDGLDIDDNYLLTASWRAKQS
ncbi:unnamed protein product [Heterobilharzia americana]|nr:unnamed protein product [Heterobilharzia americana]